MDLSFLAPDELLTLRLASIYAAAGYGKYTAGRLEPYDLYSVGHDFGRGGIISFTDARGRLMALKPDVTMSIIKNITPDTTRQKLYYCENVFRIDQDGGDCKEIPQAGLEYIGGGPDVDTEVLSLALASLREIGGGVALDIGHAGFALGLLEYLGFDAQSAQAVQAALEKKSVPALVDIAASSGIPDAEAALIDLSNLVGNFKLMLERAEAMAVTEVMRQAIDELRVIYDGLCKTGDAENVRLDLTLGGEADYYNGVVFRGYVSGTPSVVLAGGRYDGLMRRFKKPLPAIGFAVYLGELGRTLRGGISAEPDGPITVAMPKGRLSDSVYKLFAELGYDCPAMLDTSSRALVMDCPNGSLRYLLVKPSDVPVYVERGAADIGVAGSDVLKEGGADVYELLDLNLGKCRMACAARNGFREDTSLPLRVATKYPQTAARYFESINRQIDLIKLNGSIELAPILGLSDVIVDIVETGSTLKENDLGIIRVLEPVSARLIANKASCKFRAREIFDIKRRLEEKI